MRAHTYASEAEAAKAVAAIDTARPLIETATSIFGPRGLRVLADAGHVEIDPKTRAATLTPEGVRAGLVLDDGRCTRAFVQAVKSWALPIALADGTFAVPVCAEVAGVEVLDVDGLLVTIPDDRTAQTVTGADLADPVAKGG